MGRLLAKVAKYYSGDDGTGNRNGVAIVVSGKFKQYAEVYVPVSDRIIAITRDFSVNVGDVRSQDVVGDHGLRNSDERGENHIIS